MADGFEAIVATVTDTEALVAALATAGATRTAAGQDDEEDETEAGGDARSASPGGAIVGPASSSTATCWKRRSAKPFYQRFLKPTQSNTKSYILIYPRHHVLCQRPSFTLSPLWLQIGKEFTVCHHHLQVLIESQYQSWAAPSRVPRLRRRMQTRCTSWSCVLKKVFCRLLQLSQERE